MTTYKMGFGPTIFDIKEEIRDLQVKFRDGAPSEIQLWQTRAYYLLDHLIKQDQPWCTVIRLHPTNIDGTVIEGAPGDAPFATVGITLDQALTILAVLASQTSPLPDNIVADSVTRPVIPSGVKDTLDRLQDKVTEAQATLVSEEDNLRLAQDQLAQLNEALAKIAEDMSARQAEWDAFVADSVHKKGVIEAHLASLDKQLQEKASIVADLDRVITEKSTESTELTAKIDSLRAANVSDTDTPSSV